MQLLGARHIRTTAYHPEANGMVERMHRQLKASLMAQTDAIPWVDKLPMILLAMRTTFKPDLGCSPAELVYGTTLKIPAEFGHAAPDSIFPIRRAIFIGYERL